MTVSAPSEFFLSTADLKIVTQFAPRNRKPGFYPPPLFGNSIDDTLSKIFILKTIKKIRSELKY